jgi:hypothetical protein
MSVAILVKSDDSAAPLDLTIDKEGVGGVTGKAPTVAIRDGATTNSYLDFNDNIFKTVGWTTKYSSMAEVERGHYQKTFNVSVLSLSEGDILVAEYHVDDGADVIGDALDVVIIASNAADLSLLRKQITNRLESASGNPGTLILYDDDGSTPFKTWELRDETGGAVLPAVGSPARRGAAQNLIPSQIPDLVAWYDASVGVVIDGITGNVQRWDDQSVTGDGPNAPTTTAQPLFVASVPSLNNLPALQFVSTGPADVNNMSLVSPATLLTNPNTTTLVVCQLTGSAGLVSSVLVSDASSATPQLRALDSGGGLEWNIATGGSVTDGLVDLNPHLIVGEFDAVGVIRVDGVTTASGALGALQYSGISIGAGPLVAPPPTDSWNGYIAEILIYDRVLTAEEISGLEASLMEKYGL